MKKSFSVLNLLKRIGNTDISTAFAVSYAGYGTDSEVSRFLSSEAIALMSECKLCDATDLVLLAEKTKNISVPTRLIKLAELLYDMNEIHDNPPTDWSREKLVSYFAWCHKVTEILLRYKLQDMVDALTSRNVKVLNPINHEVVVPQFKSYFGNDDFLMSYINTILDKYGIWDMTEEQIDNAAKMYTP